MNQFKNNLGQTTVLTAASFVQNQYGPTGAVGSFASVFDSQEEPSDPQLRIYNLVTYLGDYRLPLPGEATGGHVAILGKLIFGIGGASCEVDFDWKTGAQISVAASFIRVLAAYSEVGPATPPAVKIAAMYSSGSRAARSQVTRSYPQILVNDENPILFPVPPYAHALNLFSTDKAFYEPDAATIRYVGGADNGFSTASTSLEIWNTDGVPFLNGLSSEDGVRFPECAKFVEISVPSGDSYMITPCFTLSL